MCYGVWHTIMVLKGQYGGRQGQDSMLCCVLSLRLSLERTLLIEDPPVRVGARATKIAATTLKCNAQSPMLPNTVQRGGEGGGSPYML